MSTFASPQAKTAHSHYTDRALRYDHGDGGWHVELGHDFVQWLSPIPKGIVALDLACGTGLVTLPLAQAIGKRGKVIGIDLTVAMLDVARSKVVPEEAAEIIWVEHDITRLEDIPELQEIKEAGGFDLISCCSALLLLPSAAKAITYWAGLLKPGGRLIIDVPTEDKTLQYLFTVEIPKKEEQKFDRSSIKSVRSLEKLFEDAGLVVEKSWKTRNYLIEKMYEAGEWETVWAAQVEKHKGLVGTGEGKREESKRKFKDAWDRNLNDQGSFRDGHWLYVVIGRKP